MRALRLWSDIVEWRWTPAVSLSIAASTFVLLAVVMIPDHIGDAASASKLSTLEALRARGSSFAANIAPNVAEPEPAAPGATAAAPNTELAHHVVGGPAAMLNHFPRRGFTPPLPRPELAPPPPVPEPPPPAAVVIPPQQLQAPPPAPEQPPPAPPAPPPAPEVPQAAPPTPEAAPPPPQ